MAMDVQILTNVLKELTVVVRHALTLSVVTCVLVTLATDWEVIDDHAWVSRTNINFSHHNFIIIFLNILPLCSRY